MNNDSNIPKELEDPITLDIIDDPITLGCCGRVVSRQSVVNSLKNSLNCPLCAQNMGNFDPIAAPKVVNMAYMIEEYHRANPKPNVPTDNNNNTNQWNVNIEYVVTGNTVYQTVIGELNISNPKFKNFSNLLLAIVDKSGSMSGKPIQQVQYSLRRLVEMTFRTPTLMTCIVPYCDTASSVLIDRINGIQFYENVINGLSQNMGGTSFRAAFDEIIRVAQTNNANDAISQMTVVFLTDGQDGSGVSKSDFETSFKQQIKSVWSKPFVIHTIGFGGGHDFNFLNKLKMVGTSEGEYKFADPAEDNDSLSNNINSIMNVISETTVVPIQIKENPSSLPIIGGENGKYWVNLGKWDPKKTYSYDIVVNGKENVTVLVSEIKAYGTGDNSDGNEGDQNNKMQERWMSYLIDEIANELIMLSTNNANNKDIDKQIHLELLQQRSRSIVIRLQGGTNNYVRLQQLMETIDQMKKGLAVNQMKLNNIKSEGKFKTITSGDGIAQKQGTSYQSSLYGSQTVAVIVNNKPKNPWQTITMSKRNCKNNVFKMMGQGKNTDILALIEFESNKNSDDLLQVNEDGSNLLIIACSIQRRINIVKPLLDTGKFDINYVNKKGFSALDTAFVYGVWKAVDLLLQNGAKIFQDGKMLLRTCIARFYFKSADRLVKQGFAIITDDMINDCPNNEGVEWLSVASATDVSIETAIVKGMFDYITNMVLIHPISIKQFFDIFAKSTNNHIRIFQYLLELKLIDLFETIDIVDEVDQSTDITWPLYVASKKGNLDMVNFILQNTDDKNLINKQNKKGVTALWAAVAYGKNIEVVASLLTAGVDPNIPNIKGDSCLIPACQKEENLLMVEILLDSGARLDVFNPERENAVLICCRTGQAKILELLLKTLDTEQKVKFLQTAANIDQFWPLIAAVELDKTECIRVCLKYGTSSGIENYIERRTPENNAILPGATSVHLACQYNRLASLVLLADNGANMRAKTTIGGFTCMHIAIKSGHRDIIAYLLSTEIGRESLQMLDDAGRMPQYYSTITGNEHIYEEFFVNKLGVLLEKSLYSGQEVEQKCLDVITKYGKSLSCYHHDNITEMNMGKGETLLVKALLNGNLNTVNSLLTLGASTNKVDDFGISPDFWLHLLGNRVELPTENTVKMLDRIKTVAKSSIQNKMLTNLASNAGMLIPVSNKDMGLDHFVKMNDGFTLKVKNDVLTTLKSFGAKNTNHSLLTFIDKVKNTNKDVVDYMIFQAKVQLIKTIAASDKLAIEPNHIMAIYLYTSSPLFYCVNKTLMNWNDKQNEVYKPFIGALYQGLKMLPVYNGEVYRAVDTQFDPELYAIDNVISWNAFSVCSKARGSCNDIINSNKGIVFVIQSTSGRDVSKYTDNPANEDVIFLPESKFRIANHHIASMICIAQANIRNTTYGINEKNRDAYYGKALGGKTCIVIALEEVNAQTSNVSIQTVQ